jgi:hypothetical protein
MFAISQVILNTTGAFKNINQISTYSIITGLVLYASIYLYLLFYNEEYVNIFNKFVIYVIMIDLLLSIFYYFNIKKSQSQNKILAENPLGEDVDETEDDNSDDNSDDIEDTEGSSEGVVEYDVDVEDALEEDDVDFEEGDEGDIDFEEGDDVDVEDAVDFDEGDVVIEDDVDVEDAVGLNGSSDEIFCPNDVEDDVIDIRDVEAQAIPNANELSFLEEPVKQKPKRVYKKKAMNLN